MSVQRWVSSYNAYLVSTQLFIIVLVRPNLNSDWTSCLIQHVQIEGFERIRRVSVQVLLHFVQISLHCCEVLMMRAMSSSRYYDILGVESSATSDDIKHASVYNMYTIMWSHMPIYTAARYWTLCKQHVTVLIKIHFDLLPNPSTPTVAIWVDSVKPSL